MKKNTKDFTKGFTLIEIIIVLGIGVTILIVVTQIFVNGLFYQLFGFGSFYAQQDAVASLNKAANEIRQSTTVVSASPQSVTIWEYLKTTDAAPSQVRFYLNGTNFMKGTIPPSGSGPTYTYDPASETFKTVVTDVQNGGSAIYQYYDQNNNLLSAPYTVGNITLVGITLTVGDPKLKITFTATTEAQLRDKKTNL